MRTSIFQLGEEATETIAFMLEPDYLRERIRKIDRIEGFLLDQWRDFHTLTPETALDFIDTLRCLRKDFGALAESVCPDFDSDSDGE